MATLPTAEENAGKVLQIFQHFETRPEEGIGLNNIIAIAAQENWRMKDMDEGLQYGIEQGWFEEKGSSFFMLTQEGYAEI